MLYKSILSVKNVFVTYINTYLACYITFFSLQHSHTSILYFYFLFPWLLLRKINKVSKFDWWCTSVCCVVCPPPPSGFRSDKQALKFHVHLLVQAWAGCSFILFLKLPLYALYQGFSKSTFKGPNLNFHQCQRSGPEQLVITRLVFNKHA